MAPKWYMPYNSEKHKRKSIRLKGYDYSQAGLYFITICVKNRACLFGNIENGKMILNDAGKIIEKWYYELEHKFPDIKCDAMIVMPNHFHCIIKNVGANTQVCPDNIGQPDIISTLGEHPLLDENTILDEHSIWGEQTMLGEQSILGEHPILGEHVGSPLQRVVQWFKTMTTNEYIRGVKNLGWQPFNGKLWQRNYYEHIVRNERAYYAISHYIINNPIKWEEDKFIK